MELDVSELLKKKISEWTFEQISTPEYIERDDFRLVLKSPLSINGRAVSCEDDIELTGRITVSIEAECSKCLEECVHRLEIDFEETFSKTIANTAETDGAENSIVLDAFEYYPIQDGKLLLDDMVLDQIILSMPVRLLCNEECKGLCPNCGANLNKVDCDCEMETVNPKFAALKDLFKQS